MESRKRLAFIVLAAWAIQTSHAASTHAQDKTPPWTIEVGKLQGPVRAWPDEKFQLLLPVFGGPKDEEFEVFIQATRLTDREGKAVDGEKKIIMRKHKFGDKTQRLPTAFDIDVQDIQQVKPGKDNFGLLEGTWEFKVSVLRHPDEKFDKPLHETPPVKVLVRHKKLRVLFFIDGPTREYQFARTLFSRHPDKVEVFVHAKNPGFNPDVELENGLTEFPNQLGPDPKDKKGMSLSGYDLVIAVDPDWDALKAEQIKLLEQWVNREAGGFILVAGPVNTYQLGTVDEKMRPLQAMLPVVLKDLRLHPDLGIDKQTPYSLKFTASAGQHPFLKLDAQGDGPLAGWDKFFWGEERKQEFKFGASDRGMYHYYPVERVRPAATVLATYFGPKGTRIHQGKDETPYFASMPYGSGKTFFIGSGETWRLRTFKESYHERFWLKLARHMSADHPNRDHKAVQVLIVDGDPVRTKKGDRPDSYYVKLAIDSITANPYEVVLGHELVGGAAAKALERDDLAKFGAILLLNVRDLKDKQLANLEKYAADGGGVGFFLGPKVSSSYYNESLFKEGKGLFPVPLESSYYPPGNEAMLKREAGSGDMVLLRFDVFPKIDRYPVFGPIFRDKDSRSVLKDLPIKRYFKVPREQWHPDPARAFELATLPNEQPADTYQKTVLDILFSQQVKAILEDPANKKYAPGFLRHRTSIVVTVAPNPKAPKTGQQVAQALDNMLRDRGLAKDEDRPNMTEFWASKDEKIQKLRADVAGFLQKARYGDPLVVGSHFGKGRVLVVTTTAGPDWNDWAVFGKCLGSFVYQPFIWESVNFLSEQKATEEKLKVNLLPGDDRQLVEMLKQIGRQQRDEARRMVDLYRNLEGGPLRELTK